MKAGLHQGQFVRFVAVGVLNTSFSFGIYVLLVFAGMPYVLANLLALIVGVLFSFRTQGQWVFRQTGWSRLKRFVPVWGLIYLVNIALIGLLMRRGLDAYAAGFAALPVVVLLSYWLQKRWVFAQPASAVVPTHLEADQPNRAPP
jgi:putative flippase GtrA